MIKLGQVLYTCDLEELHTLAGYRPRLKREAWVVCKLGKSKGLVSKVTLSNGSKFFKFDYYEGSRIRRKPNEVHNGFFKTEIAAVRALVEKKNPYASHDYEPEWADEWVKDQAVIKRAIAKLRGK